jgi:hypothetical protein
MLIALSGGACAKARAANVPDGPPLAVPAPPPRVLVPVQEEPLAANPAGPDRVATVTPAPLEAPPRPIRRPAPAANEPATPPAAAPPAAASAPEAPREIRPAPSSGEPPADQQRTQALLNRAANDLKDVDYGKLNQPLQEQYRLSQRWSKDAAEALKERNFLRAYESAQKAANMASALLLAVR